MAADQVVQGYEASKKLISKVEFGFDASKTEKESFSKTYNWIENLLSSLSKKTSALIDKAENFISWSMKNTMINRAVKASNKEITQNQNAYKIYMEKANSVGLSNNYIKKIQEGTLSIEEITDKSLSDKIEKYQEWYDKAQAVLDTINDLYDKQRDLIRQKLDNVLDYYNDIDSYLSSITSKVESFISFNESMGRRTSLTTLVEQFASLSERMESVASKNVIGDSITEGSLGDSQKDSDAVNSDRQNLADSIQAEIDGIQSGLENTAIYQNLLNKIKANEAEIAELDKKGYDNLTKRQKKSYDKMQGQLQAYYAQKEALDENATASNIAEYNKIYLAWRKLQDKLDKGKNLSDADWKKYNNYTQQLNAYADDKANAISELNDKLDAALNSGDKLEHIERAYKESEEGIRESYRSQIDDINGDVTSTQKYKNLLAKAQKLEQKKNTKGLNKSEQAKLNKYNAELEALRTGGMSTNVSEYMKTWEAWYQLQQKLDNGKKLSDNEAQKYDTYKARLDEWNKEKQTQINDLLALMENDLEQLQKTYTENISEAESDINDYYSDLYSLARQIAEYNITALESQLTYLESCISYYKELVSLYDSFSGDKLAKILVDLGEIDKDDVISSRMDVYDNYLAKLQEKYDTTLSEINEYNQLKDALDSDDFENSMDLFNKAMESYRAEGNTAMAEKLQSVLDLLNERAIDADNWGEYADEWANEWEEALSSAKQALIGTATEIQNVNDTLREIRFENITNAIEYLEKASGILSSIEGLIQDDWLFDDNGITEYGRAKAALLVSQLEDAQQKANQYLNLYKEIQNNKDTYSSDTAYKTALNEALQNYYDSLGSAASLENSVMELMKKNSEKEVNSLKDVIEARKKALQSKKEYYDYDRSIKNSQKEIDNIKAQIDAMETLSGATDAATKAKLAQLKAELAEKEDALQETKDEHTFNLQIDALDNFTDSLTDALDKSTSSIEEILDEQKEIVNSAKDLFQTSSDTINETIERLTAFYSGMDTTYIPPMLNTVQNLPDYISQREIQPNINIHYDNMINVEGNVDRDFARELPRYIDESYRIIVDRLHNELKILK